LCRSRVPATTRATNSNRPAEALGAALADRRFALVLTSPLQRASGTCRLAGLGDLAEQCDDLCEWDYGDYEGRTTHDIRAEVPGWTVWTHLSPGGESPDDVGARVDRVIERARAADGDAALFGHGHSLRVLGARWCGLAPSDGRLLALDTATISVLGCEREAPVIRSWNGAVRATA
jgi:probable phosphoglycerate mutase